MSVSLHGVFVANALVQTGAYTMAQQVQSAEPSLVSLLLGRDLPSPHQTIFFTSNAGNGSSVRQSHHPYRSRITSEFYRLGIARDVLEYVLAGVQQTDKDHFILRHRFADRPMVYEVRVGDGDTMPSTALEGGIYNPEEERFFGVKFLAHVHSLRQGIIPSGRDLHLASMWAYFHPDEWISHLVLGITAGEPTFVKLLSRYDSETDRTAMSFEFAVNYPMQERQSLHLQVARRLNTFIEERDSTGARDQYSSPAHVRG